MSHQSLFEVVLQSSGAGIDSRTIKQDQIFFALPGTRTDGAQFAEQALNKGAKLAVVPEGTLDPDQTSGIWPVKDVLRTMQQLAKQYRRHLTTPVLAITGSNGKTTNKNLLAAALSTKYKVHSTAGNFNNHIGLPLTILNAPIETEFLLLEMGTNHFGEIAALCEIAEPDYGSILNIGKTHLEFLHSEEGVLKAKSELADFLYQHDGKLFLNKEEVSTKPLTDHPVEIIGFDGEHLPNSNFEVIVKRSSPDILLDLKSKSGEELLQLKSVLWGEHNVRNLIHALGVGAYFGVAMESMVEALSAYVPQNNRSQIIRWKGFTVYLDAYNANPTSMILGIRTFFDSHSNSGVLVLGDMGELGAVSIDEHRSVLELVNELGFVNVYLIGQQFQKAGAVEFPQYNYLSDINELSIHDWPDNAPVFVKGSRSVALERLLGK